MSALVARLQGNSEESNSEEPRLFHLLSFEGPDRYSRAGGIASRVSGLSQALAERGFETHLWFVGDPRAPGHEQHGNLCLHRWCQWLSGYYPIGVYEGEHEKVADYARSLPAFLLDSGLRKALAAGVRAVVMAEEWHTVPTVLELDALLRREGLRERVILLWNANNDFGFERVDWKRLQQAATISTVSRYMRHRMWQLGVDPIALPNGIESEAFAGPSPWAHAELARRVRGRLLLAKVARWDPSKRWLFAMDSVLELKHSGQKPLLIARGGIEAHEREVRDRCHAHGLRFAERADSTPGARGLLDLLSGLDDVDVLISRAHLDREARSLLFRGADAVLANSGHEPFGLVGLEAMAVGGVACTGNTGEEYAQDGLNALVLQTNDARELVSLLGWLRSNPGREDQLRQAARTAAREYSWERIVERALLPRLDALGGVLLGSERVPRIAAQARDGSASGRSPRPVIAPLS